MERSVLFLIPNLSPGGAEILLIQQVQWMRASGWKTCVALLSQKNDANLVRQLGLPQEDILILDAPFSVLNTAALQFALRHRKKLAYFARRHKVLNIVAHLPLAHFWGRLLKLKMPSIQLLVYHHSMQYQASPLNTLGKKLFNQVQKVLAARTDDVSVCISQAVKHNIGDHFVLNDPVVLYNAVPDRADMVASAGCHLHGTPGITLVLPGRLHPAKGHLFFLKVFRQLVQEEFKLLRLVIAGGGALEEEIRDFINHNRLEERVEVTGFLSNDCLLQPIAASDLVVIPSVSEGLGLVAIEALMLGKTIVASDAGGLKEVIIPGQNGYLFESNIHNSCLNVLHTVLSNWPHSLLPPAVLRKDYERRFSFDAYIREFTGLLKEKE